MHIPVITLAAAGLAAIATPVAAGPPAHAAAWDNASPSASFQYANHRRGHRGRHGYDGRVWRDDDGRYRCRRDDGTVGLLIGGAAGALVGREIDGGRDRAAGTIIGGVAGALLGREVDRSDAPRCE